MSTPTWPKTELTVVVLVEIAKGRGVAERVVGTLVIAGGGVADQPHDAAADRQEDLVAEVQGRRPGSRRRPASARGPSVGEAIRSSWLHWS